MSTTSKRPGNDWEIGFCQWLSEKIVVEKETNLQRLLLLVQFKHGMKPITTKAYLDEWIKARLIRISEDGLISVNDEEFFKELMGIATDEIKASNKKRLDKEQSEEKLKKKKKVSEMIETGERDKSLYALYVKNCEKEKENPISYDDWLNNKYKDKVNL